MAWHEGNEGCPYCGAEGCPHDLMCQEMSDFFEAQAMDGCQWCGEECCCLEGQMCEEKALLVEDITKKRLASICSVMPRSVHNATLQNCIIHLALEIKQ